MHTTRRRNARRKTDVKHNLLRSFQSFLFNSHHFPSQKAASKHAGRQAGNRKKNNERSQEGKKRHNPFHTPYRSVFVSLKNAFFLTCHLLFFCPPQPLVPLQKALMEDEADLGTPIVAAVVVAVLYI